jgi:hypothetical protein
VSERPTPVDVADRLVALKACIIYALGAPPRDAVAAMRARAGKDERAQMEEKADEARDAFWTPIYDTPVFDALTDGERAISEATLITLTEEQQIDASWWIEGAAMLAWAVHIIDDLPPFDVQVSPELLQYIPNPKDLEGFRKQIKLRSEAEIDEARAAAELWHWRSRTRELKEGGFQLPEDLKKPGVASLDDVVRLTAAHAFHEGTIAEAIDGDFPARGKAYGALSDEDWSEVRSIAVERHRALNWLTGRAPNNRWDETPTET